MEVAYVLPFFALLNIPDLGPKGTGKGVKPLALPILLLCPLLLLQTEIQTASVSIETQTIEVTDEMENRRQREKEEQLSPIYPWDMRRAARETEGQPLMLLPLHEVPTRRNNQSMRVNKPFSYQEIQRIKEDLGDYLEDPGKYIRAFKGVTLHYELTWKDVMYILGQTLTLNSKSQVLGKAVAYGNEWLGKESIG